MSAAPQPWLPATRYPNLFAPLIHGRLRLRNRIVHAAMTTRRVFDQTPTDGMIRYYRNRAAGGAAMVVTEPLNTRAHPDPGPLRPGVER